MCATSCDVHRKPHPSHPQLRGQQDRQVLILQKSSPPVPRRGLPLSVIAIHTNIMSLARALRNIPERCQLLWFLCSAPSPALTGSLVRHPPHPPHRQPKDMAVTPVTVVPEPDNNALNSHSHTPHLLSPPALLKGRINQTCVLGSLPLLLRYPLTLRLQASPAPQRRPASPGPTVGAALGAGPRRRTQTPRTTVPRAAFDGRAFTECFTTG